MRVIDARYRTESRGVIAALIRLLGNFDLAEEALARPGVGRSIPTPATAMTTVGAATPAA